MTKATVTSHYGSYIVRGTLYQCDYDFPGLVQSLGYGLRRRGERCDHRGTDGTVDCPHCGKSASKFISESIDILDRLAR
jgi:hypothetical protein